MTPDFPSAAATMAQMWEKGTGQRIDGVIAIDVVALAHLLKVTGPVGIPSLGVAADSRNVASLLLSDAYSSLPTRDIRQAALVEVGRKTWERLYAGLDSKTVPALKALGAAASGKHLIVWSRDHQQFIDGLGLSGRLKEGAGIRPGTDYLMVVGQNAAASKMDFHSRRRLSYRVRLDEQGVAHSSLRVTMENKAAAGGVSDYVQGPLSAPGFNRTYLSAYLPAGVRIDSARLNGQESQFESDTEKGLRVASRLFDIGPGGTAHMDLSMRRKLYPDAALPGKRTYRLVLQAQPSLHADDLDVTIELPKGFAATGAAGGLEGGDRIFRYRGRLSADRQLVVHY
ncbi:MAG: DUF4012 domain-containing protein, partial [Actinomycetota bacterium]